MNIAIGLIVFFVSLIALVAEIILYFFLGFGATFSTSGTLALEGLAFFFVGLMILTGAIGLLCPTFIIIATITKRKSLCIKLFLIILGVIFFGYFIVFPLSIKKIKTSEATKVSSGKVVAEQKNDEKEYINNFLVLKNIRVIDGYGKFDVPGYSNPKKAIQGNIKNTGDKSISLVGITVYFLDSKGSRVGEKPITILSTKDMLDADPPLRPNYSKDFGYIIQGDAPSEWAGKVEVEISKIMFAED